MYKAAMLDTPQMSVWMPPVAFIMTNPRANPSAL